MNKKLALGLLSLLLGSSLFTVAHAQWGRHHRYDNDNGRHRWEQRGEHRHHHHGWW